MKRILIYLFFGMCLFGCKTSVNMDLPNNAKSQDGKSAYEIWAEAVKENRVPNWDSNSYSLSDYYRYTIGNPGKDGENGKNGKNGKNAYELWTEAVEAGIDNPHNPGTQWDKSKKSFDDFWYFLTGNEGKPGNVPHIGENHHWYIGDTDTGVLALGNDGAPGANAAAPVITIGENGNWFINGDDINVRAVAVNGSNAQNPTITIGENGNWFINGEDSGHSAKPTNGTTTTVAITEDGFWKIGDEVTTYKAFGDTGDKGSDGLSAYNVWKNLVNAGSLNDPHNPSVKWPSSKNSEADFFEYLSGKNGANGADGAPGANS